MAILTDEGSAATWLFGLGAFHHTHDIVPVLTATGPGGHDVRHLRHHRRALAGDGPHWVGSRNTSAEAISAAADAAGQVGADRFVPIMGPRSTMVAAHDELRTRRKIVPYLAVSLSCLFGLGISFFGFAIRRRISATGFTVMGCTNKLLTLLVNSLVWTHHASLQAQVFVLISIAGGVLYSEFAKADADLKKQLAAGKASPPDKEKGLGALQHGAKEAGIPLSSKAGGAGGAERCADAALPVPPGASVSARACLRRFCACDDLARSRQPRNVSPPPPHPLRVSIQGGDDVARGSRASPAEWWEERLALQPMSVSLRRPPGRRVACRVAGGRVFAAGRGAVRCSLFAAAGGCVVCNKNSSRQAAS